MIQLLGKCYAYDQVINRDRIKGDGAESATRKIDE